MQSAALLRAVEGRGLNGQEPRLQQGGAFFFHGGAARPAAPQPGIGPCAAACHARLGGPSRTGAQLSQRPGEPGPHEASVAS